MIVMTGDHTRQIHTTFRSLLNIEFTEPQISLIHADGQGFRDSIGLQVREPVVHDGFECETLVENAFAAIAQQPQIS